MKILILMALVFGASFASAKNRSGLLRMPASDEIEKYEDEVKGLIRDQTKGLCQSYYGDSDCRIISLVELDEAKKTKDTIYHKGHVIIKIDSKSKEKFARKIKAEFSIENGWVSQIKMTQVK